ncbi:MAG: type II secretion system F family protein [Acidimicrobiia bacterium]|nr:type II secretion system F family protein [Acidimicrobiia bacterium]
MASTTFGYKVRDRSGTMIEGTLEGANEQLVVAKLREMGYVPVSVTARSKSVLTASIGGRAKKVSLKDVVVFTRQLATMVNAGLTILRALMILTEQTQSKALAEVATEMTRDIERGLSLSQAVARHPTVFPPVYRSMVRAGESGGALDTIMLRMADTLEKQLELRGKVKSAMSYPIAVAGIVVVIVTAMLLFVVPMFEGMYDDLGGQLPLPTRMLITMSGFVTGFWWLLGSAGVGGTFALRRWKATPAGRLAFDRFKLRLPVFGQLIHKTAVARFTRTFGSLIRSGVPIMESMDIVSDTSGNAVMGSAVVEAKERVRVGEPVSTALGAYPVFPPMVVQMMAVGEETGALDEMLEKIADFYDGEVSATVDSLTSLTSLTSLIEPLLMVFMGVSVGGMVVALYMPMFQIINLVK